MDATAIEEKWRKRWADAKCFEPDPDSAKEKRYITAAFPYPNSPQHIGHGRTYTTADIYARYLRMKGFHVLFPMAFHVTGTPILAMAKRIAKKDKEVLDVFENIYGIDAKTAESLTEPKALVTYFSKEIEQGMKEIGYSMDWRRKFYSFDPKFNKFIQWQFRKLKELGYLIKGEYPIAWCPSDGNALSAHDTKGDVDPELEDVTVIKFKTGDGKPSFVVTTYRPETIYGVTNIWVNPDAEYVIAEYGGEKIYISKNAAQTLDLQLKLKIVGDVKAEELLKLEGENPVDGKKVPVFKASFVSPDVGTGIVMCVPAHAPKDYLALRDLGKESIEMPQVLSLKGYSEKPAKDAVEKLGVKNQDDPKAEEATKEIYTKEAHDGVMVTGKYKGQKGIDAKVKIAKDLTEANSAFEIVTLANGPVFCRCGTRAVVNIQKDQWFIDYGQSEWKKKAMECLDKMTTLPEKTRDEYIYTIDWLKTRPCTRATGLGTKFPFDENKMIEALSDSTIYMAFYTISHMLDDYEPDALDEEFFDYVLLGKGKPKDNKMDKLRESFLYWYPVDSRHSAGDLIRNHLTLYIFNHVGIFEKKEWPKQIVTNGFVTMDGAKMSKSMGNILPLRKAIKEYGADIVRFSVVCGADLTHDTDFNTTVAEGMRGKMAFIDDLVAEAAQSKSEPNSRADKWLLSRLNRKIQNASELYDKVMIRHIALEVFYDMINDLHWYNKRTEKRNLKEFLTKWIPLIAPFMPHFCEEYWSMLGEEGLVSFTKFPEADKKLISDEVEMGEGLVRTVHGDIEKISNLIGKKPEKVFVYVAGNWKRKAYELLRKVKSFDGFMKEASADAELKPHMKELTGMVKQLMRNVHALPDILSAEEELDSLKDAEKFLSDEVGCQVTVLPDSEGKHPKAKNANPNKPAIVIE